MATAVRSERCVDADEVNAFLSARLGPDEVRAFERHIAGCGDCRALLSELARFASTVQASAVGPRDAASQAVTLPLVTGDDLVLAPGATIGRYVVLSRLGAGGMGVVYAAHDPELDRKVALKLLREGWTPAARRDDLRERLRLEAQAMARLAHPNVVAVYDVGSFGERIFIAMELVEGETLARWLAARPRGWREVLARLAAAGEGLAAAHAAGLVHRDFKPENVLLGADGRVRVSDFGLARPLEASDGNVAHAPVTGSVEGTPYYMAPEQYLGHASDARTDQFGFCVTVHLAITGEHPFAGDSAEELADAVLHGRLRPAPRPAILPRWLRRVLQRGMATRPEDRYPSMKALLAALASDPRRRLLRAGAIAVPLLVLVAGGVLAARASVGAPAPCEGAERKWAGIWDEARAREVERAFRATGRPFAAMAFADVARALGGYSHGWAAMHKEACQATRVRGEQSEDLLERRMLCLDARLRDARALVDRFAAADARTVELAPTAVGALGDLASCADAQLLASRVPPPADPATRARVAELRGELAAVKALHAAGHAAEGRTRAEPLAAAAHTLGYRPLEAEVQVERGAIFRSLGDSKAARESYEQAVWAAEAGHADELAATAWTRLIQIRGTDQAHFQEALALGPRVTALLERLGGNPELEGDLRVARAGVLSALDRFPEAQADADASLALYTRRFGADDLHVADALDEQASVAYYAERFDDSRRFYERELAIRERVYGAAHPAVARVLVSLGSNYSMESRYGDALATYAVAAEILNQTVAPDHPDQAALAHEMGIVYEAQGDFEKALAEHQRAVSLGAVALGKDHPSYGAYLMSYGYTLVGLGRYKEALPLLEQALALFEARLGPDHVRIAVCLEYLSTAQQALQHLDEARTLVLRAIGIYDRIFGPENYSVRQALLRLGYLELMLDKPERALAPLERAYALGPKTDPGVYAEIQWTLAVSLSGTNGDRQRALALGRAAHEEFTADARERDKLPGVEAWFRDMHAHW